VSVFAAMIISKWIGENCVTQCCLNTDGNSAVRPTEVGIRLRDGTHAQLVVGTWQEAGKRASERHGSVAGGTANSNADEGLFSYEAFNELVWIYSLQSAILAAPIFNHLVQVTDR